MTDREKAVETIKARIEEWNAEIDRAQERLREASRDMEKRYAEQIAEMAERRDQAQAKLEEIRETSNERWREFETNTRAAWDDISRGFQEALKRFQ